MEAFPVVTQEAKPRCRPSPPALAEDYDQGVVGCRKANGIDMACAE
jgi:hypothetical protein